MSVVNQYRQKRGAPTAADQETNAVFMIFAGGCALLLTAVLALGVALANADWSGRQTVATTKSDRSLLAISNAETVQSDDTDLAARRLRCRFDLNMWSLSARAHGSSESVDADEVCNAMEEAAVREKQRGN
jgi:hypothetical protein